MELFSDFKQNGFIVNHCYLLNRTAYNILTTSKVSLMRTPFLSVGFLSGLLLLAACANQSPTTDNTIQQAPVTSGENAPPGSIHNLPVPAGVQAARDTLAARLNVAANAIVILEAHEKDWSDSCLGLGGAAESCAAVITPGYDVLMTYQGKEYRYRTSTDGSIVRAE